MQRFRGDKNETPQRDAAVDTVERNQFIIQKYNTALLVISAKVIKRCS